MAMTDSKRACFVTKGLTLASIPDMEIEWLQLNGAIASDRMEAWQQFLGLQGFTYSSFPDARNEWLESLGYTGSTQDMLTQLWEACPDFSQPSPSAWIDGDGYIDAEDWID